MNGIGENTMNLERKLFEAVIELIEKRYPSGWGGAAAVALEDGSILTSIAPEVINASTELCMETGAILEAHKLNRKVTHSLCVVRDTEQAKPKVLTPCVYAKNDFFTGDQTSK